VLGDVVLLQISSMSVCKDGIKTSCDLGFLLHSAAGSLTDVLRIYMQLVVFSSFVL
jgi:hypothetical protein